MQNQPMLRLGFLASHNGSNMQALIDACRDGKIAAQPALVISNNAGSGALERARREGLPSAHLSGQTHPDPAALDAAILASLREHQVQLVLLCGYMKKLGPETLAAYSGAMVNIHPSLLPDFGGPGMYGVRVHEAVLAAGRQETGATVHLVEEDYDRGPIIAQCQVPVLPGDTAETLQQRVLPKEHELYVGVVGKIAAGRIRLPGLAWPVSTSPESPST